MKTVVFLFGVLCASTAFGQSTTGTAALSAQPVPVTFVSRPEHASPMPMGREQSILTSSANTWAHGERPLWEFATKKVEIPLGDIARELRKEHSVAKKPTAVFENQ
jgi:hypothetical protein